MTDKTFRAYAAAATSTYDPNPNAAARAFFERNPNKRKCSVTEGIIDGSAFVVAYSPEAWPRRFKDVTKKMIGTLV